MKKKLNEEGIVNELAGGSAFFRPRPALEAEPATLAEPDPVASALTVAKTPAAVDDDNNTQYVRPYGRTYVRRKTARYAFEFYADQLDALKQFSLHEQLAGGVGNMSGMVREAVDEYISKRKQQVGDQTNGRSAVRTEEPPPQ
jgi:hypothetical protein